MDVYLQVLFWLLKYSVLLTLSFVMVFMLAYPLSGIGFLCLNLFQYVHNRFKPKINLDSKLYEKLFLLLV